MNQWGSPPENPGRLDPPSAEGQTVPPTGQWVSLLFALSWECRRSFPDRSPLRAQPGRWLMVKELNSCTLLRTNSTMWHFSRFIWQIKALFNQIVVNIIIIIMTGYWCCSAGHSRLEGMKTLWVRRKSLTQGSAGRKQTPTQKAKWRNRLNPILLSYSINQEAALAGRRPGAPTYGVIPIRVQLYGFQQVLQDFLRGSWHHGVPRKRRWWGDGRKVILFIRHRRKSPRFILCLIKLVAR